MAFTLSPGNHADISEAPALLDKCPPPARLLADKGYDANSLRDRLAATQTVAVIPSTTSRKVQIPHDPEAYRNAANWHPAGMRVQIPHDPEAYRNRNRIERAFCRLKDWRHIATRYDKLAINFASAVAIAAVIIWWT